MQPFAVSRKMLLPGPDRPLPPKHFGPFLANAAEQLLVVTAPALLGGRALSGADPTQAAESGSEISEGCGSYTLSAESLASVLDAATFDFMRFVSILGTELTETDGAMPITGPGAIADFQQIFKRLRNFYLYADGVEIWDFDSCYVSPFSEVAPGAVLMPGTILKGTTSVAAGRSSVPTLCWKTP